MRVLSYQLVTVIGLLLIAIALMAGLTTNAVLEARLAGYLADILPFILGVGAGGLAGGAVGYQTAKSPDTPPAPTWTWLLVGLVGLALAAIVAQFGLTADDSVRGSLLDLVDQIVPFVLGGGLGAAIGGTAGYFKALAGRAGSREDDS